KPSITERLMHISTMKINDGATFQNADDSPVSRRSDQDTVSSSTSNPFQFKRQQSQKPFEESHHHNSPASSDSVALAPAMTNKCKKIKDPSNPFMVRDF